MNLDYFSNRKWFCGSGAPRSFYEILDEISSTSSFNEVHIGTDSHALNDNWTFASVVCLYHEGKGGKYYFFRSKRKKSSLPNLRERLYKEVEASIMLASVIRENLNMNDITVHADTSMNPANKSFASTSMLKNFIVGMGFKCKTKPEAWAAAGVADKHSK
jgi:predicted RNase H-related nuclease YkuK (DUF458 family)